MIHSYRKVESCCERERERERERKVFDSGFGIVEKGDEQY